MARGLTALGFQVLATNGTYEHLRKAGVEVERVNKVREGRPHCVDRMLDGDIHLVINTTQGAEAIKDSFSIRRTALHARACPTSPRCPAPAPRWAPSAS